MYLRSITLKGFKSFPDRTRLDFAEGVSVIVGPNGSGKSNVTEAVLWALGEQRPLAVRGQTMQDVIFSGGHGLPARSAAEVEVVLDNSDFAAGTDFGELSIRRRLERSGEGEYRLNGARCRLVDVLEALSDTGLGKEMHSVVSQGRVEGVIHSRPEDRRLLIEEAAGLGKHRKRRRRAELKLERTADNLARALDVEREARSRLRPLKRQAEAADLHERLERQSLEARLALARDSARVSQAQLEVAEREASAARAERAAAERRLTAVAERRRVAEEAIATQTRAREALSGWLFAATSAVDRIDVRLERVREAATAALEGASRARADLERLERADREDAAGAADGSGAATTGGSGAVETDGAGAVTRGRSAALEPAAERIAALEAELGRIDADRRARRERELSDLARRRDAAAEGHAALERSVGERSEAVKRAAAEADASRAARRTAERAVDSARADEASATAALAAVERLARATMPAPGGARSLGEGLRVDAGYELAVAAVLGPLLRAGLAADVEAGARLLDGAGADGGTMLLGSTVAGADCGAMPPGSTAAGAGAIATGSAPGAERLLDRVRPEPAAAEVARRLLGFAWVVDSLESVPAGFAGIAVTRGGRALFGSSGELRQVAASADERALGELGRRDQLAAAAETAAAAVVEAQAAVAPATAAAAASADGRDAAEAVLRGARAELADAAEALGAVDRALGQRRSGADEGPEAVRRAELEGQLKVERRMAERAERERAERRRRMAQLKARAARQSAMAAAGERAQPALVAALDAVGREREALRARLADHDAAGTDGAAELRECAREEEQVQASLRRAGEAVTGAEVRAQRARDGASEQSAERDRLVHPLGLGDGGVEAVAALTTEGRAELDARVERLARRREQLGPVNPLAKAEYEEAIAHVEDLESQRGDLETALAELEAVIAETDRRIRESFERTFEATAKNFEEVVEHLFPGGRGRLRLVSPETPRAVLGGEDDDAGAMREPEAGSPAALGAPGVEVEVTPAGKSMRRLSLLSGGEKSLVALAFLFAVFLARPCPFYVLDEVEAALDDLNIERFLNLVRRCSDRAQFIVVTHQKRTMDVADRLYGVSMGSDGVSKVVSRKLAPAPEPLAAEGAHAA